MAGEEGESLRELFARLIEQAKGYASAELAVGKAVVAAKADAAKGAVAFGLIALFLVQAGLTVLVAAVGMAFAHWLGTAGGLAVGAVLALALAGLLGWLAAQQISGMGQDR